MEEVVVGAVDSPHPDYPFDSGIKAQVYRDIYHHLEGERVKLACSFPHLSAYRMEHGLVKRHPDAFFHCFEKDPVLFSNILQSFRRPDFVSLVNADAEKFISLSSSVYDFIFFDYMSGPGMDIEPILGSHLREGGLFALTEYVARGRRRKFTPRKGFRVLHVAKYSNMDFRLYRKESGVLTEDLDPVRYVYRIGNRVRRVQVRSVRPSELSSKRMGVHVSEASAPMALPVLTEQDMGLLTEYFEPKLVDLFKTLTATSSFTQTSDELNDRWKGNGFFKYKVRIRWSQMLEKVEMISGLSDEHRKRSERILAFMQVINNSPERLSEVEV